MMTKYNTIVIGGGATGLSIGYHLKKKGNNVLVLEGDYWNAGSTGRNLGVLKARIPYAIGNGNEDLVKLAQQGLKLHGSLSSSTGINTFYRKGGLVFIAKTEEDMQELDKLHKHFKKLGVAGKKLTGYEMQSKWPYINGKNLLGGYYSSQEANAHPFGLVWAYLEGLKTMKAPVKKQNKAKVLKKTNDGFSVEAEEGKYEAENIVVACAERSNELLEQVGYTVPMKPLRKEVCISEPMRPFFGPSLERLSNHYQIVQTMRGEIMGTIDWLEPGYDLNENTPGSLNRFANETVSIMPSTKHLRIIRQWTGICDVTPDEKPAIGDFEDGLYVACGLYDYGITLIPAIGKLLANTIISGKEDGMLKPFTPKRFQ